MDGFFSNPNGEEAHATLNGAEVKRQPKNLLGQVFSSHPYPTQWLEV